MKEPLYFHIVPKVETAQMVFQNGRAIPINVVDPIRAHSYSVTNEDRTFYVGYSVVHKKDQFNRKRGLAISKARMLDAINTKPVSIELWGNVRIHDHVNITLSSVIKRSAQIRKVTGEVEVIINCDHNGAREFKKLKMNV